MEETLDGREFAWEEFLQVLGEKRRQLTVRTREESDDVAQKTTHGDVLKRRRERAEAELGGDACFQSADGV